MELTDQRDIAAPPETVWAALLDADVLKQCVPGCKEMTGNPDDGYECVATQKVGPVKATFKATIALSNVVEGQSCTITGEGKGGAAGFAKGGAAVTLEDEGDGTLLSYDAEAKVGGKLAQLGSRLIDGYARKMSDAFFDRFKEAVEPPAAEPDEADENESDNASETEAGGEAAQTEQQAAAASGTDSGNRKKGWFRRLFG